MLIPGSPRNLRLTRTITAEPTTKRIRSKPMPGQPPENVEYRRLNDVPSYRGRMPHIPCVAKAHKGVGCHSLELGFVKLSKGGQKGAKVR